MRASSSASKPSTQIAGYFTTTGNADEDRLVQGFGAYNYLVQAYIGYCFFYRDAGPRAGYLEAFRTNFGKLRRQVTRPIGVAVPALVRSGEVGKPGFREQAQNEWAAAIVNASAPLISMVDERQARGFHVGARAFISQIFHPFG